MRNKTPIPVGLSVPYGSAQKSADPESTTTPVEELLSRALIVGAVVAVFAYMLIAVFGLHP